MTSRESFLRPALWGGGAIGLLTAVPMLNWINCMCCSGVLAGGLVAVYLYRRQLGEGRHISTGDGAVLGLLAGLFGAVVSTLLGLVFNAMLFDSISTMVDGLADPAVREQVAQWREFLSTPLAFAGFLLLSLISYAVIGLLGGLLGVSIWGKGDRREKTVRGCGD